MTDPTPPQPQSAKERLKLGPADQGKRWTDYDRRILDDAVATGRLPDKTPASQNRLARYLGFSRQTIVTKLNGRKLPLCTEAMSDGGRMSQYVTKVRKAVKALGQKKSVRRPLPATRSPTAASVDYRMGGMGESGSRKDVLPDLLGLPYRARKEE